MADEDGWLVLRAQSGDREALEGLLTSVQGPLHRYVTRLLGNPAAADDVLQETLLRIYRKLRWLDEPSLFRPWAYRIASREAFRFLARQKLMRSRFADEALESIPEPAAPPVAAADVDRILSRHLELISSASRAVLLLHYRHDLTIDEVAGALELSPGTVKSRLAYGLRRLRDLQKGPANEDQQ